MQKAFAIRFLVTVLAVGCAVYWTFFTHHGALPFTTHARTAQILIIQPRPHMALPRGLRAGDRLVLHQQSLAIRFALNRHTLPGETYTLSVQRGARSFRLPVTSIPIGQPSGLYFVFGTVIFFPLVLGLVTLWWGRDWAAWGLSLFAIGLVLFDVLFLPLPGIAGFAVTLFNWTFIFPLTLVGFYITAFALAGAGLTRSGRRLFHSVFFILLIVDVYLLTAVPFIVRYVYGRHFGLQLGTLGNVGRVILNLIPLMVLAAGYVRSDTSRRLRIRWVLWSMAVYMGANLWNNFTNIAASATALSPLLAVWYLIFVGGLAGLIYAVLKKRVVAVSFVFNRTLVYGLTGIVVIGVFAFLATIISNVTALHGYAGVALSVGVSLALGLVLDAIRGRIDSLIERLFFRRKFQAEGALRRFTQECPYMEHSERLLDRAIDEVDTHIQARGVALYERSSENYVRVRVRGEELFPERIETDDRVFVTMPREAYRHGPT